jgi:hypothetical protein
MQPSYSSDKDPRVHVSLYCEDEEGKKSAYHFTKKGAERDKDQDKQRVEGTCRRNAKEWEGELVCPIDSMEERGP